MLFHLFSLSGVGTMPRRASHYLGFGLILLLLGLSACGQKGELYLPEEEEERSSLSEPTDTA